MNKDWSKVVDDLLVMLTCSDCKLSPGDSVQLVGCEESFRWSISELERRHQKAEWLLDAFEPPRRAVHSVLASDQFGSDTLLSSVRVPGMMEKLDLVRACPGLTLSHKVVVAERRHILPDSGSTVEQKAVYLRWKGVWNLASARYLHAFPDPQADLTMAAVSEWLRGVLWAVEIRHPGCPAVWLPSDPTGIREFLKDRDRPAGASRRAALKHWVREHWRRSRRDPDVEHEVRQHLRGAETGLWHGLEFRVLISEEDGSLSRGLRGSKVSKRRQRARRA